MKPFSGFPARVEYSALPNLFFSALLPYINDINELKVTLHLFKELSHKRGRIRFATRRELITSTTLRKSLGGGGERPFQEILSEALEMTVKRGTFLELTTTRNLQGESLFFLSTEANVKLISLIERGELELDGLGTPGKPIAEIPEPSDIFTLYEDNIGMLTPIIADQLKQAECEYPLAWIQEAITEAALYNKHNWTYIARILENWTTEGKSHGTHRGDSAKKTGADKYVSGKYGHMVQR